jgi:hypothetical protein
MLAVMLAVSLLCSAGFWLGVYFGSLSSCIVSALVFVLYILVSSRRYDARHESIGARDDRLSCLYFWPDDWPA